MYENPFAETEEERSDEESMDVVTDPTQHKAGTEIDSAMETETGTRIEAGAGIEKRKPRVDRGDNYVLHFYDLAARKPHSLYQFVKA
jgi:hypothetical protein